MRDLKIDELPQVYGAGSPGRSSHSGSHCGTGSHRSKKTKSSKHSKKTKSSKHTKKSKCHHS